MKSKNWNEMKNMSRVELNEKLSELQDKIFRLRFRHLTVPVKNPLEIREIRKDIARIKTLIAQKKKTK
ncbi:50S ribosomal protein L29 [Endomicrobiia bacterium]|uniref:Large ribosomal subunit protein uL29 n=1 Tax=Endomicrobium trichonymphae TaxID=1408204 RepID=B1GZ91_ENDTX|nr:50S ribosomal protein L29 [Candidatus Endomicrobium trichonymphae]GHT05161.1 50S ribosomal protein L29 [Endomicrobiia bacterium]BAG13573.1 50S ribosomal protein L29 [Candidatus Endomicrobium trichonymphae]BAV58655.1 50S ribosomal protein L29 [Candidatus Endomicrobium trichonymphae]GHT10123.1 50S ribosomal protein L29 [Endomicrobiia bacterium]GHT14444.1 50S ribosomal protein L29 [Endomicrobiia bacterium]